MASLQFIPAATKTTSAIVLEGEFLSTSAHVATAPGRTSDDDDEVRDVAGHHSTGAYEGVFSNTNTANDRCIRSDTGAFCDCRCDDRSDDLATRKPIVGEDCVGTDEHSIAEAHPIPNSDPILNHNLIADNYLILNVTVFADVALAANSRSSHYVRKGPDAGALSDPTGIHQGQGMLKESGHHSRAHCYPACMIFSSGRLHS